jgi:hypothetical protein
MSLPQVDQENRRKPWLETSQATIANFIAIAIIVFGGIWWSAHADSQINFNRDAISLIENRISVVETKIDTNQQNQYTKLEDLTRRLQKLEDGQAFASDLQQQQLKMLADINSNLHRNGR